MCARCAGVHCVCSAARAFGELAVSAEQLCDSLEGGLVLACATQWCMDSEVYTEGKVHGVTRCGIAPCAVLVLAAQAHARNRVERL